MKKLELFYQKNQNLLISTLVFGMLVGTIVMIILLTSGEVS